ncbi:MAG: Tim44/TimA family putative adaptor protein [Paracoccaceae bacterium]
MGNSVIQLLVLAFIAIFLILRLKNLLGTREGFERKKQVDMTQVEKNKSSSPSLEIIEGGLENDETDRDITDHVKAGSKVSKELLKMKKIDKDFVLTDFLTGAREAYEMILLAFKRGDITKVNKFISKDVESAFSTDIDRRNSEMLKTEATFGGIRELTILDADLDGDSQEGEITIRFLSDLTLVVKNKNGEIVEGGQTDIQLQKDIWTFSRVLSSESPNWTLVATEA